MHLSCVRVAKFTYVERNDINIDDFTTSASCVVVDYCKLVAYRHTKFSTMARWQDRGDRTQDKTVMQECFHLSV